ncbi:MAG: DUF2259 domain-containing protein [Treponema sp.]|nr:DUF2259 domain-containing protein [Treponema sp.]
MLKKTILILIIIFTGFSALWAGDTAIFVDLGFSPDGRTFMFGQYGIRSQSLHPWAETFIVDVARNNFVPNGRGSLTQNAPIRAGQDGSGVFHQLVSNNAAMVNRYNIDFQNQGMPLYISRNENPPRHGERITFRDFHTGRSFSAQLVPTFHGSGQNVRSQFHINLDVTYPNGQVRRHVVGTPQFLRPGITQYNFKRVIIDSTGNSLVFVIEMRRAAGASHDIRYMVETIRF